MIPSRLPIRLPFILLLVLGVIAALVGFASAAVAEITADTTAHYVGEGRWNWTVFINAPPETLDQIKCVEYTLHRTFKKRHHKICKVGDARRPFALKAKGWGTFEIGILVHFRNESVQALSHMLRFEPAESRKDYVIRTHNDAKQIGKRRWRWTVYLDATEEVIGRIKCVEYTLHPTFPDPVKEVCERGTGDHPFALTATGWGIFVIDIRVFFDDGSLKKLNHQLEFLKLRPDE